MGEVHYFPRYSQPENVVTNNTLLLLLRLREFNRHKFEKFMESLFADQEVQLATSWLQIQQQKGTGRSIVDGYIAQDSVKIAVETKLVDAFNSNQLEAHLGVFKDEQHKLLILLSPSPENTPASQLQAVRNLAAPRNIQVLHISFEEIVEKVRACLSQHDEEMDALATDFETFCSEMQLLPTDKYTLFVPPCGQSFAENEAFSLYYCPATWNRRNAKYLGIYKDKQVRSVGEITKVAVCEVNLSENTVTVLPDGAPHLTADETSRVLGAARSASARGWDVTKGHKFFLCNSLEKATFRKTSPGGIMGHRYFDLREFVGKLPSNVKDLANELGRRTWE